MTIIGHRSFGRAGARAGASLDPRGLNQFLVVIKMFCDDDDDGSM